MQAVVDLSALRANLALVERCAAGQTVIAVVKADAYGHGAAPVARALLEAGCPRLAVARVEEGVALRDAGIEAPILVLGGPEAAPEQALASGLTPVIHHRGDLEALAHAARRAGRSGQPVHVEVDTGMRRMGVPAEEALPLLEALAKRPALALEGLYTHLARADESDLGPSLEQLARFRSLLAEARRRGIAAPLVHALNSAGLLAGAPLREALPEANAVRPGLVLYGVRPAPHLAGELRPVMRLESRVVAVRRVAAGEAVGYAALWRAPHDTHVATVPLGYADGIPISASNRGEVVISGRRCPVVGRVSMDFATVDVGAHPPALGETVVVFGGAGEAALPVEEAAAAAGTIAYELLVRVGSRVPRVVVG